MKSERLEWVCLLATLITLACTFVYVQQAEERRALRAEQASLDVLGKVLQREIGNNLRAVKRALDGVLRDHVADQSADSALINRRLQALQEAMPQIRGFIVVGADGRVLGAMPSELVGRDFSTRVYFIAARDQPDPSTFYVSPPFTSVRGDKVVSVTRMIPGRAGQFGGTVSAVLDPRYFSEALGAVLYAADVRAFVTHGNGVPLVQVAGPRVHSDTTLSSVFTIRPEGLGMDHPLRIGIARDPAVVVEPLQRQGTVFGTFLIIVASSAAALLRWAQLRRKRNEVLELDYQRQRARSNAIQQSEARFRTLIEEAPVAVAILRNGNFIYTNRRYSMLHGYADGQSINGLPWRSMIAPQSLAMLRSEEAAICADAPVEQRFEALGLGNNANLVPVSKATTRVELGDGPATLIFVQDISAQKQAEACLLDARDAAEAASRSKAEFLANMSHEIRTPLNAILGLAYLLEQAELGPDAHAMLLKIRGAGKSLLGIINDILDVSKIDAGEMKIDSTWFRPQQVLDNVAATMGVAVGAKDIQLLVHPLPVGLSRLLGDALRLEQILINLASNAIKFTERGRVELAVTLVSKESGRVVLRFCVADTGIGIAPQVQESVFAPFTQADSSTTRRFGGSGLGLTICKKLVTLQGGEIGVDSTPGVGSEFWFTLPFETATDAFSSPEMTDLHAMIVHEDGASLAMIASTARGLGWRVSTAGSNQEVLPRLLAAAHEDIPDVLVLNRPAHDTTTMATAEAIRSSAATADCPVVVLTTTFDLAALAITREAALVDAFLSKPVTTSTLYNTVIAARRKRGAQPKDTAPRGRARASLGGVRLLVVDDSEINRDVARRIFVSEGAQVTLAEDGQKAIDWLLEHPAEVDLVLMDIQMPVLDGIAACMQLRALDHFADLPIVALTAGAFQTEHDAARAAGMTDFISKPFDIPHTIALIQRLRRRSIDAPPAPIDIAHGIALWGERETFITYLRKFATDYEETIATLRASTPRAAAALAHKLAGAAGNVALPQVARAALEVEQQLATGAAPPDALTALEAAMAQAVAAIWHLPQVSAPAATTIPRPDIGQVSGLIDQLLAALHSDNPAPARPLLTALGELLPPADCAAIVHALDEFDFRSAERATHALAVQLASRTEQTP